MAFSNPTDHWGISDTNFELESSEWSPNSQNAQVQDSNGDNVAETVFDTYAEVSSVYNIISGTDLVIDSKVKVGTINNGNVVTGVELSTSNTAFPQLTVTGQPHCGDTSAQYVYANSVTVSGVKTAQGLGAVSTDSVTRLSSASLSVSSEIARVNGDSGACVATDVYGARAEVSAEGVSATGDPAMTADTGWTAMPSGQSDEVTGYGSGSRSVFKNLTGSAPA